MAGEVKTQAELDAQVLAGIKVNGNKEITPPIDASIRYNQNASFITKKDAGNVVVELLGYTTILTPSDDKHFTPKKYVDDNLLNKWGITGNTLTGRGKLGSSSGAFGFDYIINNVVVGHWSNSGVFTALNGISTDGEVSFLCDTTDSVTKIGFRAGELATGLRNIWAGLLAGRSNDGDDNVAIGDYAGYLSSSNLGLMIGPYAGYESEADNSVYIGGDCGRLNMANEVKAIGGSAARENEISDIFTVATISNIFWNNVGDKGFTTLQAVTMQTAMAEDGTNQSAVDSIMKFAPARATGNALSGNIVWQFANIQASGTTRHTLSDGMIYDGNTGYLTANTSTSENVLLIGAYQSKSATYTALTTDKYIECTSNTFTVTLYTAGGNKGREIVIDNSGAGIITVDGDGAETINGALTYTLNPGESVTLVSNGTNWRAR